MKLDLKQFYRFCSELKIESKEQGLIKLDTLLGTQTFAMNEIAKGLDEDIHFFVILKGRQLGVTTISLALDLYQHFVHQGLQGTLVTDTEENREMFRSTLSAYMEGLPKEYRIPLVAHNRNQLTLRNRSRMVYQVAGLRAKGSLGRGKAITYMHATETSSWGDEEGLASLLASLAEKNPMRLYLFESTARGFNMFHDMWVTAKRARTQRAIFVGWWLNQFYTAKKGTDIYRVYWDGKLSSEEREWVRDIKKLYGHEVNSEQIAWWRWKLHEGIKDEGLMMQEFPPTEDYAFVMSGTSFFSTARCTDAMKVAKKIDYDCFRFNLGARFEDTELNKSTERLSTFRIWEYPVSNGYYVIGADPAYGSSDWADRFCIQVYRAYADGLDQVAEFCTHELNTFQFAWIICYIAGVYRNSVLNLEINGPGQAVLNEMRNLKRMASAMGGQGGKNMYDVLGHMQHYLWRRNDSLSGVSNSIGYLTTSATKERMLNYMKDYFERGIMQVYSAELIDEMKSVVRDGGSIEAYGRGKDDRVMASGLAAVAYAEQVWPRLIQAKVTRLVNKADDKKSPEEIAYGRSVTNYLRNLGISPPTTP